MAEYIEREEYCEKHCRCSNEYCDKESCPIWKAPAADVAPVVRCKDCAHTSLYEDSEGLYCTNICGLFTRVMDDDYCSYGERKGGVDICSK